VLRFDERKSDAAPHHALADARISSKEGVTERTGGLPRSRGWRSERGQIPKGGDCSLRRNAKADDAALSDNWKVPRPRELVWLCRAD
jgi:hypothetical protein